MHVVARQKNTSQDFPDFLIFFLFFPFLQNLFKNFSFHSQNLFFLESVQALEVFYQEFRSGRRCKHTVHISTPTISTLYFHIVEIVFIDEK